MYEEIEKIIGYTFKEKDYLLRAFTHASFTNEHKNDESYERMEFLGDATLGFVAADYLFRTYPNYDEGQLTKLRARLVSEKALSSIIDKLDVIKYLRTGASERDGLASSSRIKCNLFEAIIGAIVLDNGGDLAAAKKFIIGNLKENVGQGDADYKSALLEWCAKNGHKAEFNLINAQYTPVPQFVTALLIDGKQVSDGTAKNKKQSEKNAAEAFYKKLKA